MVNESLISVCKPVHSLLPGFLIAMHMCADTVLKMMLHTQALPTGLSCKTIILNFLL